MRQRGQSGASIITCEPTPRKSNSLNGLPACAKSRLRRHRRAHQSVAAFWRSHASSRERWKAETTLPKLYSSVGVAAKRSDIGCGVHPSCFLRRRVVPRGSNAISRSIAIRKTSPQRGASRSARQFQEKLLPVRWDLAEGWSGILERARCDSFDLASHEDLPVVERQHRESCPAVRNSRHHVVLTGSRISRPSTFRSSAERNECSRISCGAPDESPTRVCRGRGIAWVVTKPAQSRNRIVTFQEDLSVQLPGVGHRLSLSLRGRKKSAPALILRRRRTPKQPPIGFRDLRGRHPCQPSEPRRVLRTALDAALNAGLDPSGAPYRFVVEKPTVSSSTTSRSTAARRSGCW